MSLQPLLDAPWVIQVHAFSAAAAFLLGLVQFTAPKGTLPHRALGGLWVVIMSVIAISSIFIRPSLYPGLPLIEWFGFIHIFTILTLYGVIHGVILLRRGGKALKYHSRPFISIYIGGLVVAGAFAFLPGRIMHAVIFGA